MNPFSDSHVDYLKSGLQAMVSSKNTGNPSHFPNQAINESGFTISKESFLDSFRAHAIHVPLESIPEQFLMHIKYSPISLFKKWVFHLSNHKLLKVSERSKGYEVEFFIHMDEGGHSVVPFTTNVAHERFLYTLYQKESLDNYQITFNTSFNDRHELVMYKDYLFEKEFPIRMDWLPTNKRLRITAKVNKDSESLTCFVKVATEPTKAYSLNLLEAETLGFVELKSLKPTSEAPKKDLPIGKNSPTQPPAPKRPVTRSGASSSDMKAVIDLIGKFHGTTRTTNKFANVALGRVNKIPVLINMPSHYKNTVINIRAEDGKLHILDESNNLIKVFAVSHSPKSNWLVKNKN